MVTAVIAKPISIHRRSAIIDEDLDLFESTNLMAVLSKSIVEANRLSTKKFEANIQKLPKCATRAHNLRPAISRPIESGSINPVTLLTDKGRLRAIQQIAKKINIKAFLKGSQSVLV